MSFLKRQQKRAPGRNQNWSVATCVRDPKMSSPEGRIPHAFAFILVSEVKRNDKELLQSTVKVLDEMRLRPIPLGVSNRHIHLSAQGIMRAAVSPAIPSARKSAKLQPGQYAAEQTVTLVDRKGSSKCLLGLLRSVSRGNFAYRCENAGDCRAAENVRWQPEGDAGHPPVSPFAELELPSGVIVAQSVRLSICRR